MATLYISRYAEEGDQLKVETHSFVTSGSGFSLEGQIGKWRVLSSGNELYDGPVLPGTSPYSLPLRVGVTILTAEEYAVAKEARITEIRELAQASQEAQIPVIEKQYTDSDKIFLIDYNGSSVKVNADKRRHFKLLYGFDPVDEDPRNG